MNADFKKILHSFLPSFFLPSSLPLSCPLSFLPSFFFSCFCYYFKYTELHCSHFSLLALLLFPFLLFFSPYFFAFPSPPFLFSSPFFLPPSASSPSSCMSDKYGIENKKAKGAQSQGFNVTLYSGGWQRSNSRFQETRLRSIAVRRAMPYYNT